MISIKQRKMTINYRYYLIIVLVCLMGGLTACGKDKNSEPKTEQIYTEDTMTTSNTNVGAISEVDNMTTTEMVMPSTEEQIVNIYKEEYVGTWWDLYSQRAWMTISYGEINGYTIEISWSSSASENSTWILTGNYSEELQGIKYKGELKNTIYNDDGSVIESYEYKDGEGLVYFKDDGLLYWDDWKNNQGQRCMFEKDMGQENYDWYREYNKFQEINGSASLEMYVQNDVVIWVDAYLGGQLLTSFSVSVEPDEIGENGEYIYYDGGITMIYYPEAQNIMIEATAGMIDGRYLPVTE